MASNKPDIPQHGNDCSKKQSLERPSYGCESHIHELWLVIYSCFELIYCIKLYLYLILIKTYFFPKKANVKPTTIQKQNSARF